MQLQKEWAPITWRPQKLLILVTAQLYNDSKTARTQIRIYRQVRETSNTWQIAFKSSGRNIKVPKYLGTSCVLQH